MNENNPSHNGGNDPAEMQVVLLMKLVSLLLPPRLSGPIFSQLRSVNMRGVTLTKLTNIGPKNLYREILEQMHPDRPPVMIGNITAVVSSLVRKAESSDGDIPLKSILGGFAAQEVEWCSTVLEVVTIKKALDFLDPKVDHETPPDVPTGLQQFFKQLARVPVDKDVGNLLAFIDDPNRTWAESVWGDESKLGEIRARSEKHQSTKEDRLYLRQFLHENLSIHTKIVIHLVDGIHRVCAHEYAVLNKLPPGADFLHDMKVQFEQCYEDLTSKLSSLVNDRRVSFDLKVPNCIDLAFCSKMKLLSAKCQKGYGSQEAHDVRHLLFIILETMKNQFDPGYLLPIILKLGNLSNGKNLKKKLEKILEDSNLGSKVLAQGKDFRHGVQAGDCVVKLWMENLQEKLYECLKTIETLWGDEDLNIIAPGLDLGKIPADKIFQNGQNYGKTISLVPFGLQDSFMRLFGPGSKGDPLSNKRYKKSRLNGLQCEICALVMWAFLSEGTFSTINDFLTNYNPDVKDFPQASVGTRDQHTTVITCVVQTVLTSVLVSEKIWKKGFFWNKVGRFPGIGNQTLLFILLHESIQTTVPFFAKIGADPHFDWMEAAKQLMESSIPRSGNRLMSENPILLLTACFCLSLTRTHDSLPNSDQRIVDQESWKRIHHTLKNVFPSENYKLDEPDSLAEDTMGGKRSNDYRKKGTSDDPNNPTFVVRIPGKYHGERDGNMAVTCRIDECYADPKLFPFEILDTIIELHNTNKSSSDAESNEGEVIETDGGNSDVEANESNGGDNTGNDDASNGEIDSEGNAGGEEIDSEGNAGGKGGIDNNSEGGDSGIQNRNKASEEIEEKSDRQQGPREPTEKKKSTLVTMANKVRKLAVEAHREVKDSLNFSPDDFEEKLAKVVDDKIPMIRMAIIESMKEAYDAAHKDSDDSSDDESSDEESNLPPVGHQKSGVPLFIDNEAAVDGDCSSDEQEEEGLDGEENTSFIDNDSNSGMSIGGYRRVDNELNGLGEGADTKDSSLEDEVEFGVAKEHSNGDAESLSSSEEESSEGDVSEGDTQANEYKNNSNGKRKLRITLRADNAKKKRLEASNAGNGDNESIGLDETRLEALNAGNEDIESIGLDDSLSEFITD